MVRLETLCGRLGGLGKLPSHTRMLLALSACAVLPSTAAIGQETAVDIASEAAPELARRPDANDALDRTPWSVMAFKGWSNYHTLGRTVRFMWDYAGEDVYGADVVYTISSDTGFGRFFDNFIAARFQLGAALNLRALQYGARIPEAWNHIVATSFSIGEGLSVVSRVPDVEIRTTEAGGTSELLNYLMLEMTLALPSLPYLQLVGRIHHRSGMFGVFGDAQESGSNTVGLGVRWHM